MKIKHGGDIYRNKIQYDFSVNINPLGMTERCKQEAMRGIELSAHYPDDEAEKLRGAIATKNDVSAEDILVGNGAAELIYALCHAIRPKQARTIAPTFQEYEAAVCMTGGSMTYTGLNASEDFVIDERFVDSITATDELVFVCNPNNPTGKRIGQEILIKLIDKCKQVGAYLLIDECFLPFCKQEREYSYFKKNCPKHVLVLRAFTKIYAMAGLRLGYMLVADCELRDRIRMQLQPWNTSISAQLAGVAALAEDDFVNASNDLIYREREIVARGLQKYVARIYDSDANFLLVKAEKGFATRLLERGILIRSCANFNGLDDTFFRIAIRTHGENEHLLKTVQSIYEANK